MPCSIVARHVVCSLSVNFKTNFQMAVKLITLYFIGFINFPKTTYFFCREISPQHKSYLAVFIAHTT